MLVGKARFLATTLDNLPAILFALSTRGLLHVVRAVLAMAQTGITSVAILIVQYALYKGSGAYNVLKSYRPVSVGSAIARVEGGCVHRHLNVTTKLAATLTPDLFAYRHSAGVRRLGRMRSYHAKPSLFPDCRPS